MKFHTLFPLLLAALAGTAFADETAPPKDAPSTGPLVKITPELRAAVAKLEMPGVKINLDEPRIRSWKEDERRKWGQVTADEVVCVGSKSSHGGGLPIFNLNCGLEGQSYRSFLLIRSQWKGAKIYRT